MYKCHYQDCDSLWVFTRCHNEPPVFDAPTDGASFLPVVVTGGSKASDVIWLLFTKEMRVNKLLIICIFPLPVLELPSHQQLSRNPGASVHEGGGKEIMEEGLHVSAALRALLFYKRNLKGNGSSLHSSQTQNTVHLKCNLLERNSVLLTAELHTPLSVRVPPGCLLSDVLIY